MSYNELVATVVFFLIPEFKKMHISIRSTLSSSDPMSCTKLSLHYNLVTAILFLLVQIDNKHMTEPWLDQALMDSACMPLFINGDSIKITTTVPLSLKKCLHNKYFFYFTFLYISNLFWNPGYSIHSLPGTLNNKIIEKYSKYFNSCDVIIFP